VHSAFVDPLRMRFVAGVLLRQKRRRVAGPLQLFQESVGRGARACHEISDLSEQAGRRHRADGHCRTVKEKLEQREGCHDGGITAGEESKPGVCTCVCVCVCHCAHNRFRLRIADYIHARKKRKITRKKEETRRSGTRLTKWNFWLTVWCQIPEIFRVYFASFIQLQLLFSIIKIFFLANIILYYIILYYIILYYIISHRIIEFVILYQRQTADLTAG